MALHFVLMGFLCVQMCVSSCLYMFPLFFLWLLFFYVFFVLYYPYLFLLYFILLLLHLDACFILMRQRERVSVRQIARGGVDLFGWGNWKGYGRSWEKENYYLNMMYEEIIFNKIYV